MTRARRVRAVVGAAAVAGVLTLPGCSLSEQGVMVAGHDENGTLVVGAASCDADRVQPADDIWVYDATDPYAEYDLWVVTAGAGPDAVAPDPPTPPPSPEPATIADVRLVAVGDPDAGAWTVLEPLWAPLPSSVAIDATVDDDVEAATLTLEVASRGEPDAYTVALDQEVIGGLSAEGAAEAIEEHCADDGGDVVRAGVITGLVATGVAGVALAIALVVATRQYRQAGVAHAAARGAGA